MLKQTLKELSGHSFFYALSFVASSAASIILLPVYTRYLTKTDYGILEILDYTNIIITIVVVSGLNSAIPKFFSDASTEKERRAVISSAMLFACLTGALFCSVGYFFDSQLSLLVLGSPQYRHLMDLNILLFFVQLVVYIGSVNFLARKQSKIYLSYMVAKLCLCIAANLFFLIGMGFGVMGMLYGNLVGNSMVALVILWHNIKINGFRMDFPILGRLIKFGLPLIPATLMATIMHNADRFLIRYYGSLADTGIYSIGYKFPFMLNAGVLQSFSLIWSGATMYEIAKQPDSSFQYGRIATYVIGFFVFAQLALSIFSIPIVKLLADEKFFEAHEVIPFVALGLCFHAFYFFFSVGTFLQKKTWLVNFAYFPAAAINIVGNMILLPRYGYMAAAWMSAITYFIFAAVLFFTCRGLLKVNYEFKRLLVLFLSAGAVFFVSKHHVFANPWIDALKSLGYLTACFLILLVCGFFTKGELESLKRLSSKLHRVAV